MDFNDPKEFDDPQVFGDPKEISIESMDFDNQKVCGDTLIFDGLSLNTYNMNKGNHPQTFNPMLSQLLFFISALKQRADCHGRQQNGLQLSFEKPDTNSHGWYCFLTQVMNNNKLMNFEAPNVNFVKKAENFLHN